MFTFDAQLWSSLSQLAANAGYDRRFLLRTTLEFILAFLAVKYLTSKNIKRPDDGQPLSKKALAPLLIDWTPEPLICLDPAFEEVCADRPTAIDCCSFDFHGILNNPKTIVSLSRNYGVGTCGPPGFYGTLDLHLQLESKLATFFGSEGAILYAQGSAAVSSVIPAFSKRGDIIVHDEAVNFSIVAGMKVSRSYVFSFKHNDIADLESILKEVEQRFGKHKDARKFIIVESLYMNTGQICDLRALVRLKKQFKFRIIVDVSAALGAIGFDGLGVGESKGSDIDIIVGGLSLSVGGAGGFCCGSSLVVEHQRLLSTAYCFSASLPAILTQASLDGLEKLKVADFGKLSEAIDIFSGSIVRDSKRYRVSGDRRAPLWVIGSVDSSYEDRCFYMNRVFSELTSRGFKVAFVRGTRFERKTRFLPLIRVNLRSDMTKDEILSLTKMLNEVLAD